MLGFAMWLVLANRIWTDITDASSYQKSLEVLQVSVNHLELLHSAITAVHCSSGSFFSLGPGHVEQSQTQRDLVAAHQFQQNPAKWSQPSAFV